MDDKKNNINLYQQMEQQIANIPQGSPLLLHACCAPCSSAVLELLLRHFTVTLYFYNPNIWPEEEYLRRQGEFARLSGLVGETASLAFAGVGWAPEDFAAVSKGLENQPEGGARCEACFRLRLDTTAQKAAELGIDWFTTTLSISPHKNAALLNQIGAEAARRAGVHFLASDFKKKEGYKRSIQLSEQYGLYRQDYCGCKFSMRKAEPGDGAAVCAGNE